MPATKNDSHVSEVAPLPRETNVDVANCHACHTKVQRVTGDQADPSASQDAAMCQKCHACHAKGQPCLRSATLATQNDSHVSEVKDGV